MEAHQDESAKVKSKIFHWSISSMQHELDIDKIQIGLSNFRAKKTHMSGKSKFINKEYKNTRNGNYFIFCKHISQININDHIIIAHVQ